jgi:hypothetical protein
VKDNIFPHQIYHYKKRRKKNKELKIDLVMPYLDYNEKDALFSDKQIFWQEG